MNDSTSGPATVTSISAAESADAPVEHVASLPPQFQVHSAEGATILEIRGEIDALSSATLSAHFQDVVDDGRPFVIDMSGVQFLSVSGLVILQALAQKALRLDIPWALAAGHDISRVLTRIGLDTDIEVLPCRQEALIRVTEPRSGRLTA